MISWVDGYDPIYQQKLKSFCDSQGVKQHIVVEPTRIQQCNEIYYCLEGLRRFAPWIRTIYIITNQQTPKAAMAFAGSDFGNKIKIIDQNKLLREAGVSSPVFNSLSVEWLIWRIEGLSNQFIYLNDDFFIIRDVTKYDFFRQGRMVLRGEWKVQAHKKWLYQIKQGIAHWLNLPLPQLKTNPHRSWQESSAHMAGFQTRFYLLPHAPFPLIKKTFDAYIADNPDVFAVNVRYPFRHPNHISSIPLMVHRDIQQQRVVFDPALKTVMINGQAHSSKKIQSRLHRADNDVKVAFVCMQSIDQAASSVREYLIKWLQQRFK